MEALVAPSSARPGLAQESPAVDRRAHRRLAFGAGVLVLVVVLQQVSQYITNRDAVRLGSVLTWFSLEL
ncbi:MAG: hypothetical protein RL701_5323, partial [Pseudomonadota bacterium]